MIQNLARPQNRWHFRKLSFEKCQFTHAAIEALALLVQRKSVHTLSFMECEFPANEEWVALLFAKKFVDTRELILDFCQINDNLLLALSVSLKSVTHLHSVSLRSNLLTPRSMNRLEEWLCSEKICEELILSGNNFDNQKFPESLTSPRKPAKISHEKMPEPNQSSKRESEISSLILFYTHLALPNLTFYIL